MSSSLHHRNLERERERRARVDAVSDTIARLREETDPDTIPDPDTVADGYAVWIVDRERDGEPVRERVILRVGTNGRLTLEAERAHSEDHDYLPWLPRDLARYLVDPYAHLTTRLDYHDLRDGGHAERVGAYHERQRGAAEMLGEDYAPVVQP